MTASDIDKRLKNKLKNMDVDNLIHSIDVTDFQIDSALYDTTHELTILIKHLHKLEDVLGKKIIKEKSAVI